MKPTARPILIVPGYRNSGPGHWQTLFEARFATARRVHMPCFEEPARDAWVGALDRAVAACAAPPVLVAHSLGCIAVAHWAQRATRRVHAALLVAPCDVEKSDLPGCLRGFAPLPQGPLCFPARLVASTNDPYVELNRAGEMAFAWGARTHVVENGGHLNTASGHGPWPEGEALLSALL